MIPPDSASDPTPPARSEQRSRRRLEGVPVSPVQGRFARSTAGIFLRRLGALDFVQTITVFGAVLMLSVLPFVIILSSLANHHIDTDLSRHIGLSRHGAAIVSQLFASAPAHSDADIALALIVATAGTAAVARSLQAIYERAFGQEHRGWRDIPRYLTWVGVLFGVLVAESVISNPVHADLGPVGQEFVNFAGAAAFFWWMMYFLLARRVPGRVLVRPAIISALLWVGLELFSSAYFSREVITDSNLYGKIGVVFILLTWFIAIGAVIVLGAAAGATWEQRKGRLGAPEAATPSGTVSN